MTMLMPGEYDFEQEVFRCLLCKKVQKPDDEVKQYAGNLVCGDCLLDDDRIRELLEFVRERYNKLAEQRKDWI